LLTNTGGIGGYFQDEAGTAIIKAGLHARK